MSFLSFFSVLRLDLSLCFALSDLFLDAFYGLRLWVQRNAITICELAKVFRLKLLLWNGKVCITKCQISTTYRVLNEESWDKLRAKGEVLKGLSLLSLKNKTTFIYCRDIKIKAS